MSNQTPSNVPPQDVSNRYDEELANAPAEQPHEPLDPSALHDEAQERSKQRPILQKILNLFQKEKADFRELIINSETLEKRVALLVDGILEKFEIERESDNRMVGGIFKGRIKNMDPGLKAAFVDIGYSKNAFLHYWDMLPAATDSSVEVVRVNKKKGALPRGAEPTVKDIPGLYPPGSEIVIQVTKGPIGTQGPRTTTNLSLPGRYLILTPYSDGCGISRKIEDNNERRRLKQLINELTIPEPRKQLSTYAPRIQTIQIDPEKIGLLIGPGGKTIRRITETTGAQIDIAEDDSGKVYIYSNNADAMARAVQEIDGLCGGGSQIEMGKTYQGRVTGTKEFGAFVECMPGKEGLVHISELADFRVRRTEDVVKMGDMVWVKCIGIDDRTGKVRLSRRAAMKEREAAPQAPADAPAAPAPQQ